MKKTFVFIIALLACLSFGFQLHNSDAPTWHYNGGSGPQIVVTYDGSLLHIEPTGYTQPLRVVWFTNNGPYNELVYGSTFTPYSNYNFLISGSSGSTGSDSYYVYY